MNHRDQDPILLPLPFVPRDREPTILYLPSPAPMHRLAQVVEAILLHQYNNLDQLSQGMDR